MRLLFLCAGNVGRSPLGEAIAGMRLAEALQVSVHELASRGVEVASAGLRAPSGIVVSHHSVVSAAALGIDISAHRSYHVTPEDLAAADRIYCMDRSNVDDVLGHSPDLGTKVALLDPGGGEVPDPRFEDRAFHQRVCDEIDRCVQARLPEWLATLSGNDA